MAQLPLQEERRRENEVALIVRVCAPRITQDVSLQVLAAGMRFINPRAVEHNPRELYQTD
jgi:hypothetical protein